MPVATRSQAVSSPKALRARLKGERHGDEEVKIDGTNPEHSFMRNPHYKLKEKLKSMAQTHENTAIKHQVYQIQGNQLMKSSHPSVDLFSPQFAPTGSVRKISMAKNSEEEVKAFPEQTMQESAYAIAQKTSNPTRVLGQYNLIRENRDRDSNLERLGYTCPKPPTKTTAVARRLTLAGVGQREAKSIRGQNHLEAISEGSRGLGELGSRIMVYVRLRPMAKKEKEAGSTSCVRIVNKRDIYITEHGMETDYLRLKRVRGRHFAFDASFPDNTSQEEIMVLVNDPTGFYDDFVGIEPQTTLKRKLGFHDDSAKIRLVPKVAYSSGRVGFYGDSLGIELVITWRQNFGEAQFRRSLIDFDQTPLSRNQRFEVELCVLMTSDHFEAKTWAKTLVTPQKFLAMQDKNLGPNYGEFGGLFPEALRWKRLGHQFQNGISEVVLSILQGRIGYEVCHGKSSYRVREIQLAHAPAGIGKSLQKSLTEKVNVLKDPKCTSELVEGVLQGRNGSVFCYGATGAGKTHTMLGTVHNPGVMVLAIKDLFMKLRQRSHDGDHVVRLSYLEVYNEAVRDLLSPGRPLVLREDKQGIVAAGLTQYQAYSTDEVMALLQQGNQNRTTEPTRMNETSSRSHAILQVVAEYKVEEGSRIVTRVGKLSLIDLAGSERALATDQRTVRSLEGANINRSLLALSSCINALVEGKKHIPYRNSKLTQLLKIGMEMHLTIEAAELQDSLGGVCHTVMIANISPSIHTFGETQNTLHWADRAKEIRTKACTANEDFQLPESQSEQTKLLLEVQKENQQLRMQIARYQQKMLSVQNQSLTSSPALSSSSSLLLPPSPLTPSANAGQMLDRHHTKAVQCFTPEPTPRQELYFQEAGKAAEETIQDLKRKIRALEMEAERTNKEFFMREKRLKASITDLKREHNVQLRHKDDFIRKLCKKNLLSNQATPKSPLPAEQEEILNFTQPSEKTTALKSTIMIPSASARPPPQRLQKIVPPNPVGSKTSSLPQNVCDASLRMGRRAHSPKATGTLKSPSQSHRFSSPAAGTGRKRTFWDITNANSPSAAQTRSTRSHPATAAPSMLLQALPVTGHLSTDDLLKVLPQGMSEIQQLHLIHLCVGRLQIFISCVRFISALTGHGIFIN
eukprot:Gb_08284 [translate_table: standard]